MRRRSAPLNRNRSRLALRGSSRHPQRGPPSFTGHRTTNAPPALLTRPKAQTAQGGVLLVMQKGKGKIRKGLARTDGPTRADRSTRTSRPPNTAGGSNQGSVRRKPTLHKPINRPLANAILANSVSQRRTVF